METRTEYKVNTQNVKDQLKKQQQQEHQGAAPAAPPASEMSIADYIKKMGPAIGNVLPRHMTPERMARIALSEIRKNPALLQCEFSSLGAAVMQAATLGLEPSQLGHCYFVPFNRKVKEGNRERWVKDVQFIIGYKGYIDLAWRSGTLLSIVSQEVRENDHFDYAFGLNERLEHIPAREKRGAVTHYYAYAKFKGGGHVFLVKSKEEITAHAFRHSKQQYEGKLSGPWRDHFDGMAKKTVIRELVKFLPLSVETLDQFENDEKIIKQVKEAPDGDKNIFDVEVIDESSSREADESAQEAETEAAAVLDQAGHDSIKNG